MALANPEQFGRLRYRQLADHHAVQYLQSRLFVLIQCHSSLKVTCSLTSWLLTFSLNNHTTDPDDWGRSKMNGLQYPELCYARAGTAWHRAQPGTPFIPNGGPEAWDRGNLQAASQPVFLDAEIRYYYAGTDARHSSGWERRPQDAGMGMASLKPDRFVALHAGEAPAELLTVAFEPPSAEVFVNARTGADGEIRVELLDEEAKPLNGFTAADCRPITGDDTAHRVEWRGDGQAAAPVGRPTRVRLTARHASVYSVFVMEPGETPVYLQFEPLRQ